MVHTDEIGKGWSELDKVLRVDCVDLHELVYISSGELKHNFVTMLYESGASGLLKLSQ